MFYSGITELLRDLHQRGFHEHFEALDKRFQKVLEFWDARRQNYIAEALIENPSRFNASPVEIVQTEQALAVHELARQLDYQRSGYRLSVLAWMLHRMAPTDGDAAWQRVIKYAQRHPDTEVVLGDGANSVFADSSLLERWVISEQQDWGFIDTDGPLLRAIVLLVMLKRSSISRLPPAEWMSEGRIERVTSIARDLLSAPQVRELATNPQDGPGDAEERVIGLFRRAEAEQRELEDRHLIEQPLDQERVTALVQAVVAGWRENRIAPDLLQLAGSQLCLVNAEHLGTGRFGFKPQLEPKGMFVSPTNWAHPSHYGEQLGGELARSEATAVIAAITGQARPIRSAGSALTRLSAVLSALRDDGYNPSLIVMPINWRLGRQLGLAAHREPVAHEGRLGHYVRGWVEGVPVTEWPDLPPDRLFAVDLKEFCVAEEARVPDGDGPEPPRVTLTSIDETQAEEIIAHWEPASDEAEAASRQRRVLTSVRRELYRRYHVEVQGAAAARSVWLPPSARGGQ